LKHTTKRQLVITVTLFSMMVTINLIGKATNKLVEHYGDGTIVDTLEINGIFCLLYYSNSKELFTEKGIGSDRKKRIFIFTKVLDLGRGILRYNAFNIALTGY
jgi:hypothetical protein